MFTGQQLGWALYVHMGENFNRDRAETGAFVLCGKLRPQNVSQIFRVGGKVDGN